MASITVKRNNVFVGGDFSQQEPRLLSVLSNDENMINAYKQGKDLYATIATGVYKMSYWDCMEHTEDGKPNPDGKKRRSSVKSLLLGLMYGRGAASMAEQMNSTIEEAQKITDDFYKSYPNVKKWMDDSVNNAKINGYVEDFWGRRRRLPDVQLPKYTVRSKNASSDFNPLLYAKGLIGSNNTQLISDYTKLLNNIRSRNDYSKLKDKADKDGITIIDNGGFIAQAERQCVNARVQGSAASTTKICMRKVYDDEELRKLGAKLVLQIHDEVICECPEENASAVADRLSYVMKTCIADYTDMPFKCDCDVSPAWYYSDESDVLQKEYKKLSLEIGEAAAYKKLCAENSEFTEEQLKQLLCI